MNLSEQIANSGASCIRSGTKSLLRHGLNRRRRLKEEEEERQRERERVESERPKPEDMKGMSMRDLLSAHIPDAPDIRLCGPICAGDKVLIAGPSNIGKSIMAMQIAIDIAEGRQSELFPPIKVSGMETDVYYFDFEMRLSQFKQRYHGLSARTLNERLVRFSPETHKEVCTPEGLIQTIKQICKDSSLNVVFVVDAPTDLCELGPKYLKTFHRCLKKAQNIMTHKNLYLTVILVVQLQSSMNKKIINRPLVLSDFKIGGNLQNHFDCALGIRGTDTTDMSVKRPYIDIPKTRFLYDVSGFYTKRISEPYAMLRYAEELVTTDKGRQESYPDDSDPLGGGEIGTKRRYTKVADDSSFDEIISYLTKEARGNVTVTTQHFGCSRETLYINLKKRYGKNWRENINITIQKEDISMDSADMDFDGDDDFPFDD